MRRPVQFSVLGLLLLTAAVAVGVKLWQGPHRAESALDADPAAASLLHWWGPLTDGATVSYVYMNHPHGRERGPAVVTDGKYLLEVVAPTQAEQESNRRRVIPVARDTLGATTAAPNIERIAATVLDLQDPDHRHVYLISNAGHVYKLVEVGSYFGLSVEPIEAETIPDAELRTAVERELEKVRTHDAAFRAAGGKCFT